MQRFWGVFVLGVILPVASGVCGEEVSMKAGVAKGVITPENWEKLTTVMGVKPTRKDHDIYARVLILNDGESRLAIVTYDLNCLDVATPILRKRCRDELKIPPSHLILMGTHNHSAPIQIVPDNFEYGRQLADRIFGLIRDAIGSEPRARLDGRSVGPRQSTLSERKGRERTQPL